jgi:hypothetical protein
MSIKLVIEGFDTIEEAKAFASWYGGQGEQDACIWFECRKDEGKIPSSSMLQKSTKQIDAETISMILKMGHDED